jgi:hypothetical protein
MVLVKPPIGGLLWVLYLTDKYLSSKTTCILHILLKSLGANYDYFLVIRSFPLLRSSCKDTPHPTTHNLCIFKFMTTFALCFTMGKTYWRGMFPNSEMGFNYCLALGPLF